MDDSGNLDFKDWWAHDEKEEKQALVDFVEWAYRRWLAHPELPSTTMDITRSQDSRI